MNPGVIIPPDYFLYETYRLNYKEFFKDGEVAAREIIDWTKRYMQQGDSKILDWGCGISMIAMHIDGFTDEATSVYACDINAQMIDFNKKTYTNVSYSTIPYSPPTTFEGSCFDLVYALSVFTHIETPLQLLWIREIHRILKDKGVFLFTTHGKFYNSRLLNREKKLLDENGAYTKSYRQRGHRMMTTYNSEDVLRSLLQPYFEILEFYDGASNQAKNGGQDLWIVRKISAGF